MSLTIVRIPAAAANQPARPIRRTPVGAVDHHMGGYLLGTDGMFQKPSTGYSTNYGIGLGADGKVRVSEYVAPDLVAWGNGNTDMNTRAVSIEHANDRSKYPDLSAKPTAEVHEASALLHAQLAVRFEWRIAGKLQLVYAELSDYPKIGPHFYDRAIPGFGGDFNVIPHRAVAKKTCPEHLDVRWIVDRANHIIREGVDDAPTQEEDDMPTAKEVADEFLKGLTSQDPASPGKQARDAIAAAAADFTLTRLVPASGDGWGKQARDAIGKSSADYAIFALATAEPGSEAALAIQRIADAIKQ